MAFKLAIASGKGGTGKTSVAINLMHRLSKLNSHTCLVDCDVEEPNMALLTDGVKKVHEAKVFQSVAGIDVSKCTFCRKCSDFCAFGAIVVIPGVPFARVTESLCHSCGACSYACQADAIYENAVEIGTIRSYNTPDNRQLTDAILKTGSPMQTVLIKKLKQLVLGREQDIFIFDAPPGTSCPVVETVSDADLVLLVAEPTPFGMHDLALSIALMQSMKLPFGVIINKSGLGTGIYDYLASNNIPLLGEIPFSKTFAEKYAGGSIMENIPEEIHVRYDQIAEKIWQIIQKSSYEALSLTSFIHA